MLIDERRGSSIKKHLVSPVLGGEEDGAIVDITETPITTDQVIKGTTTSTTIDGVDTTEEMDNKDNKRPVLEKKDGGTLKGIMREINREFVLSFP